MLIIYTCYGGAHSSPMAAAIHLNRLVGAPLPSTKAIEGLLYFDIIDNEDRGRVFPVGIDEDGNRIYVLGRGSDERFIQQAIKSGYMLAGGDPRQVLFVNTLRAVNWQMRIGGFLSRRLGLVSLGRPLVARGARRAYPQLTKIVRATKAHCRSVMGTRSPVSFPTNQE
ncbi:MAG: DUF3189 family protein [Firmicutes bacterium]|nr:DUF3189 family protein [Bacillota bacterium]